MRASAGQFTGAGDDFTAAGCVREDEHIVASWPTAPPSDHSAATGPIRRPCASKARARERHASSGLGDDFGGMIADAPVLRLRELVRVDS